jgi:hypothetical protein
MATVKPSTFEQEMTDRKVRQSRLAIPSQNKKRSNATRKADPQLLHILFCPNALNTVSNE